MSRTSRRTFMLQVAAGSAVLAAARAMAQAKVDEADPQAKALDYKNDTTKVDMKKYPKHVPATDKCATCALYQGKPSDAAGPCPLFAGKLVAASAWCSAYTKKA